MQRLLVVVASMVFFVSIISAGNAFGDAFRLGCGCGRGADQSTCVATTTPPTTHEVAQVATPKQPIAGCAGKACKQRLGSRLAARLKHR